MSSLIWRIAHSRAINFLHSAQKNPNVKASPDGEEEGEGYEYLLASLTDGAKEPDFDDKLCFMAEAFSELSEEEQQFCRDYVADSKFKTGADRQRMHRLRERLHQKVLELRRQETNA